jgi:integrase/recombinase XerD
MRSDTLYCRVTVNKTNSEFSTNEKVDQKFWNQKLQLMTGTSLQKKFINTLIDATRYELKTASLLYSKEPLTAKNLLQKINGLKKPPKICLMRDCLQKYFNQVEGSVSSGTRRSHVVKIKNLLDFEKTLKTDLDEKAFNVPMANRFVTWFMARAKTDKIDTACRHINLLKCAFYEAINRGEIETFPLINYKGKKDKVKEIVFLGQEEVTVLILAKFASSMLQKAKNLYLFQCATGMSFSDMYGNWKIEEHKGKRYFIGQRQKNNATFMLPVTEMADQVLQEYYYELPKMCNAVMNRALKEICAILVIKKNITTHTGRKTFATHMQDEGYTRESVSKMMGHRSMQTTERYYLGDSMELVKK